MGSQRQSDASSATPKDPPSPAEPSRPAYDNPSQVLHELRVHQLELELQNEELRRAHAELEATRARYFDLYDLAPVGYCTLSEGGLVVQANLTAAGLLGLSRSAVIDRAFSRFVDARDQVGLHLLLQRLLATGERQSADLRVLREGASPFWGHLVVSAAQNEAGVVERRVVLSDVSDRKEAELARREGEQRYRDLFSRASDGICLCALDGRVVEVNEAFARMHGFTVEELAHQDLLTVDPQRASLTAERLARLKTGEVLTFEVEHRHRAGHALWVETTASQVQVGGEPRVLGFYRDITERKRLQARLAQNDRLASMGLLAAGVAHEINNPLAYVLSNVESLAEDLPSLLASVAPAERALLEGLVERARSALEGSQHITKIARALSTFARVEREVIEPVSLDRALDLAVTLASNELKYRARLIKDLEQVPPVLASEGKLTQVFVNLLINAAQAIAEGRVDENAVTLRTWSRDGQVFAEVSDTGRGIAPENLQRVFEPFFTTKQAGGGSGLGLALCKNLIAEFNGELSVSSVLGQGSRFLVRLPASPEAIVPRAPAPSLPASAARGRILVVDDERLIREVLQRMLGRQHEVTTAASGQEAQALIEAGARFDLILCDLMMPEMSGMAFHAWLVTHWPALAKRVVFVSGGAFTPTASSYLESVENLELHKPVDPAELRTVAARFAAAPLEA